MGEDTLTTAFTEFVVEHERRVRSALTAAFGIEIGREATAEALAYAWENWGRVCEMNSPGADLFVVGRDKARRMTRKRTILFPAIAKEDAPWVEPGLPDALLSLSEV